MAIRTIAEICLATDNSRTTPTWTESGIVVVRSKNIKKGRLDLTAQPSYTDEESFAKRTKNIVPRAGDVIITREAPMGEVCMIPPDLRCCMGQRMVLLRPNPEVILPEYLLYSLLAPQARRQIGIHEGSGSTVSNLRVPMILGLKLNVPSLAEQKRAVAILTALDEKIDLNRRLNERLEEWARTIFSSWFIDFDPVRAKAAGRQPVGMSAEVAALFPRAFQPSELGEVPKEWSVEPLGKLMHLDRGLSYKGEFLTDEGVPMINLGCFGGGGRFFVDRVRTYSGESRPQHWVREDDLVLANTDITQDRVVLGSPAMVPHFRHHDRVLFSHHIYAVRLERDEPSMRLYLYYALLQGDFRRRAAGFAMGTTVLALPRDAVLALTCVIPSEGVRRAFSELLRPIRAKIHKSLETSDQIGALRNHLLPKLLAGEVNIRDAKNLVGAGQ
jgi:type I restriction enzyme S subunit